MDSVIQDLQKLRARATGVAAAEGDGAPVGVAIIYEDFIAGVAAKEFSDQLESELESGFSVRRDVWSFEVLRDAESRLLAAVDCATADVIIIVARRAEPGLPWYVRDWIKSWLPLKQGSSSALIGLIEGDCDGDGKPAAIGSVLGAIAQEGGMDFFCQTWKCPSWSRWSSIGGGTTRMMDALAY